MSNALWEWEWSQLRIRAGQREALCPIEIVGRDGLGAGRRVVEVERYPKDSAQHESQTSNGDTKASTLIAEDASIHPVHFVHFCLTWLFAT